MISQFHVLFLSVAVGGLATMPTTVLLLGIDFAINLHGCFAVWRRHKDEEWEECGEELMTLTVNEFLEFIVPICYLVCFLVAFYGPNAHLVGEMKGNFASFPGNVQSSYWHYIGMTKDDIGGFVETIGLLVCVDGASLLFALVFLKWKCNINMFKVGKKA
jgi:hypothetical protein